MSTEGYRIHNGGPTMALTTAMDSDTISPDTFLSYRTSRFCVTRRVCGERADDTAGAGFSLPPAAVATPRAVLNRLQAEDDEGDVEYKWRLTGITPQRFEHLVTQMQFRVREGRGQCLYEIGVRDDGRMAGLPREAFDESVQTIRRMAAALGFECEEVRRVSVNPNGGGVGGRDGGSVEAAAAAAAHDTCYYCAELLVSRRHAELGAPETSVAFCGTTGSGKSTLMGVLFSESLDDGNGTLSQLLFNHKHEVDSGRTSSLSTRVWPVSSGGLSTSSCSSAEDVGSPDSFAECGRKSPDTLPHAALDGSPCLPPRFSSVIPLVDDEAQNSNTDATTESKHTSAPASAITPTFPPAPPRAPTPPQRFISLLDLGGDITKTTLFGLMSRQPDLVCICVQAGCPNTSSAILCAKACRAMNKSLVIVVTQIDLLEDFELDSFLMDLSSELESALPCACYIADDVDSAERHRFFSPDTSATTLPIFCLSSVSGVGLDAFRACVSRFPSRQPPETPAPNAAVSFEVLLDRRAYFVEGTGPVVSGVVARGSVAIGTHCVIGPDSAAQFHRVQLCGIHVNGVHVNEARRGDEATFAISGIPHAVELAARGKVLASTEPETVKRHIRLCVHVLAQELKEGAEPVLYARNARQAIRVVSTSTTSAADDDGLGGDKQTTQAVSVECEFLYHAEILHVGATVLLHWAPHGLAAGRVVAV